MSYESETKKIGREPITIVELELDSCSLNYGVAPCSASGPAGSECYRTFGTCKDRPNYTKTTTTYRFCSHQKIPPGINAFPCVSQIKTAPTKITTGKGLGFRANVTIDFFDFPHDDIGVDPYLDRRQSSNSGTFFGKLYARNPYYQGRTLRVKTGYVADKFNEAADFITKSYIIEKFSRNSTNSKVSIVAKDPLKLTDKARSQCPIATSGALISDMPTNASSLTVTAGKGSEYGSSGIVRINDEIIAFNSRSNDTLNGLSRAQYGTRAEVHNRDDSVQLCKEFKNINVTKVIYDLLINYSNIAPDFIKVSDWDDEQSRWLSSTNLSTLISEPEGVAELIDELCVQTGVDVWWDEKAQLIRLKALAPSALNFVEAEYNDDNHLIRQTTKVTENIKDRISQVWFYWGVRSWTDKLDDSKNHRQLTIRADLVSESSSAYGDKRVKKIYSRWVNHNALAAQTSSRLLNRYNKNQFNVSFQLDAKDSSLWTGDYFYLRTHYMQDETGSSPLHRMQVVSVSEKEMGPYFQYEAVSIFFQGLYGYVVPDSLSDLTYSTATNAQKDKGCFIAPDSGVFNDGSEAYKII